MANKIQLILHYLSYFTRRLILRIFVVILLIICLLTLPILVALFCPIYVLRCVVSQLAKSFRPDLGKMLTTRSTAMAVFGVYTPKPCINLLAATVVTGHVTEQTAMEFAEWKINEKINGEYRYPELRQYISTWLGFMFWKWDKNFDSKNHWTIITPDKFTKQDAKEMREKMNTKPYPAGRSPWEIVIINNYQDPEYDNIPGEKACIFLRVHHSLCDGFSMLKFALDATGSVQELEELLNSQKKQALGSVKNVLLELYRLIKLPYDALFTLVDSFSLAPWGVKPSEYKGDYYCLTSDKISCDFIREIKTEYGVGFTSVLLSCLTAGARKGLQLVNKPPKPTDKMYVLLPFPVPGHPEKLRNYATLGFLDLSVGESNPKKRLEKSHNSLLEGKRSSFPLAVWIFSPIIGALFHWLLKAMLKVYFCGFALTSFPGPKVPQCIAGHEGKDISAVFTLPVSSIGLGFSIVSYVGGLRFTLVVDKAIFKNESQVQAVMDAVVNELDILKGNLT